MAKEDEHVREDKKECVCLSCVCGLIYSTYIKLCSTLKNEDGVDFRGEVKRGEIKEEYDKKQS